MLEKLQASENFKPKPEKKQVILGHKVRGDVLLIVALTFLFFPGIDLGLGLSTSCRNSAFLQWNTFWSKKPVRYCEYRSTSQFRMYFDCFDLEAEHGHGRS